MSSFYINHCFKHSTPKCSSGVLGVRTPTYDFEGDHLGYNSIHKCLGQQLPLLMHLCPFTTHMLCSAKCQIWGISIETRAEEVAIRKAWGVNLWEQDLRPSCSVLRPHLVNRWEACA